MDLKHNKGIVINGGEIHGNVTSIGNVYYDQGKPKKIKEYNYDVALSFASEDRGYVEIIAKELKVRGVKVFYDDFEKISLWGKDLPAYLDQLFRDNAAFCVMFISEIYLEKFWCILERDSAMNRQYRESEYILPVRLDQITVYGITDTYGYLDAKDFSPVQLAEKIIKKLSESTLK